MNMSRKEKLNMWNVISTYEINSKQNMCSNVSDLKIEKEDEILPGWCQKLGIEIRNWEQVKKHCKNL